MYKEFYFYGRKYKIDEYGNVTRCAFIDVRKRDKYTATRNNREMLIKPWIDKDGYASITLHCSLKSKSFRLHHLSYLIWKENQTYFEAKSYIGYNEKEKQFSQIDHINGDKLDNRPENLEKVTLQENIRRAVTNKIHNSQLKAAYVSIYKDGVKLVTVFKLKEAIKWFVDNASLKANSGTLSAYIREEKPWHGYIIKYESNDYRKV